MEAQRQMKTLTEIARLKLKNAELQDELRIQKDCTLAAILILSFFAGITGIFIGAWLL